MWSVGHALVLMEVPAAQQGALRFPDVIVIRNLEVTAEVIGLVIVLEALMASRYISICKDDTKVAFWCFLRVLVLAKIQPNQSVRT
jgi:hypothetical protein